MDGAAELGRNPVSKHQIRPGYGDEQADADGTTETVSRDQILRHERGQGNINFPCSADHEQDWQPYPVDPYSGYMCDHTYIHAPSGQSRVYRVTQMRTDGVDCRESAGTGPVNLKVVPVTGAAFASLWTT